MLGIGRLIVLFVSGKLSDKYGRKPFILLGIVTYISFFIGILMSPTSTIACIFGILAGIANSFLDAGTYPALIEAYPDSASTATVLLKAFISAGQFLLPLFIGFLISTGAWYGWSFIIAAAILLINLPLIMLIKNFHFRKSLHICFINFRNRIHSCNRISYIDRFDKSETVIPVRSARNRRINFLLQ